MQGLEGVTPAEFRAAGQEPLLKLDIWVVDEWINLCDLGGENYVEDISISLGGASMTPHPVEGTWRATILNREGVFHPEHPTSTYKDYLKTGRKVKVSIGAKYGDTDYDWQRIIGYIDEPRFEEGYQKISISGADYMKLLADTQFQELDATHLNYWGAMETFDSVETTQYGDELYVLPDAAAKDPNEDNTVNKWAVLTNGGTAVSSENDLGGFSDYEVQFLADPDDPPAGSRIWYQGVCVVVKGQEYNVTFKYARIAGEGNLRFSLYDDGTLVGGTGPMRAPTNGVFYSKSFSFTPEANGTLDLKLYSRVTDAPRTFRIDQISIKSVTENVIKKYQLPEACNGVHYVELDEGAGFLPVWPGRQIDGDEGWFYDPDLQQLYFAEGKIVDAGTNNLKIYYYTEQSPENVVADLMVKAGLYVDRATALATMEETATGFTIPQVWFDAGKSCLSGIKMLCERCDYRFYFKYDGTPVFKPIPSPKAHGSEDMEFRRWHISDPEYYEDRNEIRNRIVIEGLKQALPEGAEETVPSELKGTAFNQASIDDYGEHTLSIKNHLFQDQDSLDDMCTTLLARYKDPMWYFSIASPFNPAPLEIWDTIVAELLLKTAEIPGQKYGSFKYDSGVKYGSVDIAIGVRGLIRDIKIDGNNVTYKCEEVV